jgi:hypothetical protein
MKLLLALAEPAGIFAMKRALPIAAAMLLLAAAPRAKECRCSNEEERMTEEKRIRDIPAGRVDDWRGGCRSRGVAVVRRLSPNAGASFRTVAPFPVAARQTGRAELPHPAFSHPIRPSLSAGRSAGGECGRGRASHRDTRPGSGGTRRLVSQLGASTSGGVVDLCTS